MPGSPPLPELIRKNRDEYISLLRGMDAEGVGGQAHGDMVDFLYRRLQEQVSPSKGARLLQQLRKSLLGR